MGLCVCRAEGDQGKMTPAEQFRIRGAVIWSLSPAPTDTLGTGCWLSSAHGMVCIRKDTPSASINGRPLALGLCWSLWEGEGERSLFFFFSQNVRTGLGHKGGRSFTPTQDLLLFEATPGLALRDGLDHTNGSWCPFLFSLWSTILISTSHFHSLSLSLYIMCVQAPKRPRFGDKQNSVFLVGA